MFTSSERKLSPAVPSWSYTRGLSSNQPKVISYGADYQGKVTSYSQQLKYELGGLRGFEAED